jgi:hypothetical protein
MRRFNSGPRLQILPCLRQGDAKVGGAGVSKPGRVIAPRAEFRDTPLKLAHYSLTRVERMSVRSGITDEATFHALPLRPDVLLPGFSDQAAGQSSRPKQSEALLLLHSKSEAFRLPVLNLQIARTYLSATVN